MSNKPVDFYCKFRLPEVRGQTLSCVSQLLFRSCIVVLFFHCNFQIIIDVVTNASALFPQASWMHPPCNALQDLMSESVSEAEGVLLRIPKIATEITQASIMCHKTLFFPRYSLRWIGPLWKCHA